MLIIVVACMLMSGKLLPTWMFINHFSLICHIQLLSINMPTFVSLFLTQLLSLPQFNFFPSLIDTISVKYEDFGSKGLNDVF